MADTSRILADDTSGDVIIWDSGSGDAWLTAEAAPGDSDVVFFGQLVHSSDDSAIPRVSVAKSHGNQENGGPLRYQGTEVITASAAALDTGSVVDPAWFVIHNVDQTATVLWGTDLSSQPFEIPPEAAVGPLKLKTGTSLYAKASSGTANVELTCIGR